MAKPINGYKAIHFLAASAVLGTITITVVPIETAIATPLKIKEQNLSSNFTLAEKPEALLKSVEGADEEYGATFLDATTCITRGKEIGRNNQDVVVGKKLYTSIMQIPPGARITCRLRKTGSPSKYQRLSLIFGLDDDSNFTGARISVYKDGDKSGSNIITRGEINKLVVNVKDAHSVTLEIDCPPDIPQCQPPDSADEEDSSLYTVHFFQATLDPIRASVSQPLPKITSITQQKAVDLIQAWLQAKKVMLAPPYNSQLAAQLATGQQYEKVAGEKGTINFLKRNNAYYRYGIQKIEKVENFIANNNQASIQLRINEDIKYYLNSRIDKSETGIINKRMIYNLQIVNGRWKIADSTIIG
ncbi:MAG: ARC6/PARC6 family protein [Crinalium sp.]